MAKKLPKQFLETDMYPPVKAFFSELGYTVNAEVKGCDVALMKNDELIIIELKKNFNITLLYQAVTRKKAASQVYVAIPRPKRARGTDYVAMLHILEKLELGLITIAMDSPTRAVSIVLHPPATLGDKTSKARERMLKEISGRSNDKNIGGSTKTKLMTAYREKSIKIACALSTLSEQATAVQLRKDFDCPPDTYQVMKGNFYRWFKFLGNAQFTLSAAGKKMLTSGEFEEMKSFYFDLYKT